MTIQVYGLLLDCLRVANIVLYAGHIGIGRADVSMGTQPCTSMLLEEPSWMIRMISYTGPSLFRIGNRQNLAFRLTHAGGGVTPGRLATGCPH